MYKDQKQDLIDQIREQMHEAAKDLEFEKAASLRDEIMKLEKMVKWSVSAMLRQDEIAVRLRIASPE